MLPLQLSNIFCGVLCLFLLLKPALADLLDLPAADLSEKDGSGKTAITGQAGTKNNALSGDGKQNRGVSRTASELNKANSAAASTRGKSFGRHKGQPEKTVGEGTAFPDQKAARKGQQAQKIQKQPAEEKDTQKLPVAFEGDELSGMREHGLIELHSNVRVRQADLRLQSERAKVFFEHRTNDVERVEAIGQVRMSKEDAKTGEMIRAESEWAEFAAAEQKVTLMGKAVLVRGRDIIRGEVIYYDLNTGWLKASQVKGIVQPKNQPSE